MSHRLVIKYLLWDVASDLKVSYKIYFIKAYIFLVNEVYKIYFIELLKLGLGLLEMTRKTQRI